MSTGQPVDGAQKSQAIVVGPKERFKEIQRHVDGSTKSLMAIVPKGYDGARFARIVLSAVSRTPDLLECTPKSIVLAMAQAASLGLEPNTPLGLGYLVPYKVKGTSRRECQFIPGYRGLLRLAYQSGEVEIVYAHSVYELDEFEYELGLDKRLTHRPALGDRGSIIGAYAVIKMKNGGRDFEYMSKREIDAIRDRSPASGSGPWVTDYQEMCDKTVLRRMLKTAPLSEDKLARALEHHARAEGGDGPDFGDVENMVDLAASDESHEAPPADRAERIAQNVKAQ